MNLSSLTTYQLAGPPNSLPAREENNKGWWKRQTANCDTFCSMHLSCKDKCMVHKFIQVITCIITSTSYHLTKEIKKRCFNTEANPGYTKYWITSICHHLVIQIFEDIATWPCWYTVYFLMDLESLLKPEKTWCEHSVPITLIRNKQTNSLSSIT